MENVACGIFETKFNTAGLIRLFLFQIVSFKYDGTCHMSIAQMAAFLVLPPVCNSQTDEHTPENKQHNNISQI